MKSLFGPFLFSRLLTWWTKFWIISFTIFGSSNFSLLCWWIRRPTYDVLDLIIICTFTILWLFWIFTQRNLLIGFSCSFGGWIWRRGLWSFQWLRRGNGVMGMIWMKPFHGLGNFQNVFDSPFFSIFSIFLRFFVLALPEQSWIEPTKLKIQRRCWHFLLQVRYCRGWGVRLCWCRENSYFLKLSKKNFQLHFSILQLSITKIMPIHQKLFVRSEDEKNTPKKTCQMSLFFCPLCELDIRRELLTSHLPFCYRSFCKENKFVPLCTCNSCEGSHTHPGDRVDGSFSNGTPTRFQSSPAPSTSSPHFSTPSSPIPSSRATSISLISAA